MDPLNNSRQRPWWLLYGGDCAEIEFSGTRLGFLTMVGPDAGIVSCEVDGGRYRCRKVLLDQWCYFWRLAVVGLVDDLPPGAHRARLRFERERPDPSVLKRRPSGPHWEGFKREGKEHKLWLMHWLIEEISCLERGLIRAPAESVDARGSSVGGAQAVRRGWAVLASLPVGGKRTEAVASATGAADMRVFSQFSLRP